jgi:4-amino-4-deoxy-L-arabinose transferase-like glycosyltransferase
MATSTRGERSFQKDWAYKVWVTAALLMAGIAARLWLAARTFLNPDEALHYFVAAQATLAQTYNVSLTTAHPPLMFFLLHEWVRMGSSEFFLRLPFVLAGVLFSWVMFLWVRRIAGQESAWFSLAICLLSPTMIALSTEVRQYSLLLLFCALCLYALECGFEENSSTWMAVSAVALWLALLTHYSALIFAAAAGVYGGVCLLRSNRHRIRLTSVWVLGEIAALTICGVLFKTQVSKLRESGVPSEIAATWLSSSIFHRSSDHLLAFAMSKTSRLFRYLFSHGTIGVLMLVLFVVVVVALFCRSQARPARPRALAFLFTVPFVIAFCAAVFGVYPYGGTRHDVVLALFAIPGTAIGLDLLKFTAFHTKVKIALLLLLLIVCNVFASPTPPYIQPQNQRRGLMENAIKFLRSQPSESRILADYQGGLVLGYYLCDKQTSLSFGPTPKALVASRCGDHTLLTSVGSQKSFELDELPGVMLQARGTVPASSASLWLFQTGWIDDDPMRWATALRELACEEIQNFGANIRVSRCEAHPE